MITNGQKYLITTDNWFIAPDGDTCRAVWGTCYSKNIREVFGFEPSRPSTNWYLEVGGNGKEMILAGCQIHYAVRCEEIPNDRLREVMFNDKDTEIPTKASRIYIAE